ncbi:MAG: hypothetical protein QF824_05645 [Candidatus Woesearchaeota archaeon]|jgi:uncharacterized membrane protein HdeD (DUF308 family)|nr:hypothetical protein [Candidatus Woesearchaeota archaeon]
MPKSQVILGAILIILSPFLLFIPVVGLVYTPMLVLIGIALIIFQNKESEIENIKGDKKK